MRTIRVYQPSALSVGQSLMLDQRGVQHVACVLRLRVGDALVVFNGQGGEYAASICSVSKREVVVKLGEFVARDVESPCALHLAQAVIKGDKMDWLIQKAVELGVVSITPLYTQRSVLKVSADREAKKHAHWQGIVLSACEQSGRNKVPVVHPLQSLDAWLSSCPQGIVLDPLAMAGRLVDVSSPRKNLHVLIGPEGGLTEQERSQAKAGGLQAVSLGPRILRAETAALAALSVLQGYLGDL